MAGLMSRRSRHLKVLWLLELLCITCLLSSGALSQLSFVHGIGWSGRQVSQRQLIARFGRRRRVSPDLPAERDDEAEARRLTSSMKQARSANQLIEVLDDAVDGPTFNLFHASAAYHSLATWKKKRGLQPSDWDGPVIARLHSQVQDMVLQDQLDPRASANVFWSIAKVADRLSIPTELLDALVKFLPTKAKGMIPQHLSNCLWAFAQLKESAPAVLQAVPAIVDQTVDRAMEMDPQALSNCLWACAQLKEIAPDVLRAVPAISAEMPGKAQGMKPQELSNCLWAFAQLKDVVPGVLEIVPAIATQIIDKAKDMKPQELSNSLWACAQLEDDAPRVLEIVVPVVVEVSTKIKDMNAQDLSNNLQSLVRLQESVPEISRLVSDSDGEEDILRSSVARFNTLLPRLRGRELNINVPVTVWACAKLGVYPDDLLRSVSQHLGSPRKLSKLPRFSLCALAWSYQVLDASDDFKDFRSLLRSETEKKGFTQEDVESTRLGHLKSNHAQLGEHGPARGWQR